MEIVRESFSSPKFSDLTEYPSKVFQQHQVQFCKLEANTFLHGEVIQQNSVISLE